jgi:hypothetical protein
MPKPGIYKHSINNHYVMCWIEKNTYHWWSNSQMLPGPPLVCGRYWVTANVLNGYLPTCNHPHTIHHDLLQSAWNFVLSHRQPNASANLHTGSSRLYKGGTHRSGINPQHWWLPNLTSRPLTTMVSPWTYPLSTHCYFDAANPYQPLENIYLRLQRRLHNDTLKVSKV